RRTNEAFGQCIWDIRSLMRHLEAAGAGPIGALGMSLGGCLTALLAGIEPALAFAIPMIPLVALADFLWTHGENHPERRRAEEQGLTLETLREVYAVHCPLKHTPLVPRERRMI